MRHSTLMAMVGACAGTVLLGAWISAPTNAVPPGPKAHIAFHAPLSLPNTATPIPAKSTSQSTFHAPPNFPSPMPRLPLPSPRNPEAHHSLSATTIAAVYAAEQPVVKELTALHSATTSRQLLQAWHAYQRANHHLGRVVYQASHLSSTHPNPPHHPKAWQPPRKKSRHFPPRPQPGQKKSQQFPKHPTP